MQLFLITEARMWIDEWVTLLLTISWDSAFFIALFKSDTTHAIYFQIWIIIILILWIFYDECIRYAWVIMGVRLSLTF